MAVIKRRKFNLVYTSIISLLLVAAGVCLICFKSQSVIVLTICVGVSMLVNSFYSILISRQFLPEPVKGIVLIRSCFQIIFGTLIVIYPLAFAVSFYEIALWVTSIFMIADGLTVLFQALYFRPKGFIASMLIESAALIVLGILFVLRPAQLGNIMLNVLGFVLIVFGICILVYSFTRRYDLEEV